jgi:16S rRNA (uracil1498-N3)-methyltransferase
MSRLVRVAVQPLREGELVLDSRASHYLVRVRRLAQGAVFIAFDPEARQEATAELLRARPDAACCRVREIRNAARSPLCVTLLQAIGKGDKLERVVGGATALGLTRLIIVDTERSSVRTLSHRAEERQRRLRTAAVEAARQSGRGELPELVGPLPLPEALNLVGDASLKLCFVVGAKQSLGDALSHWTAETPTALLIGPEGGLSPAEIELASSAGFQATSLGPYVLRTEIAATAALGALIGRMP